MIRGSRSIDLAAEADVVYDILEDAAGFPAWQSTVREVEIRELDPQGRPLRTRQRVDAKVRTVTVLLAYEYTESLEFRWTAEKGSDVKAMDGSFRVVPRGSGACTVHYDVAVDPGRTLGLLVRGPVVDRVRDHVLDGTLTDLKRLVEAG